MLVLTLACGAGGLGDETLGRQDPIPTPDRSQVQAIDDEVPAGLTDADAISAYQRGYAHMRAAAWFSAIASYDEAIHIQPAVSGLYEARGTAYMYAGRHDQSLADYSSVIELNPNNAGHWRRRAHAFTIAPTPQPERSIEDVTRAIELAPDHSMGYAHRAVAYTQVPTPEWGKALSDMNQHIELFEGHDPEAYECAHGSTKTSATIRQPNETEG
jgi:tetratricopeptide (TPR) repeat protein